jgi:transcriptional regulator with GAF, ATPase, and Fis domain
VSDESQPRVTDDNLGELFIHTVSGLFECLGRALICLDRDFRIVHASESLNTIAPEGTAQKIVDKPVEEILGSDLFGEGAALRRALEAGEMREGWGATLRVGDAIPRLMSITAAPISAIDSPMCDPRVVYLLVVRSGEDPRGTDTALPTLFSGMVGRSDSMNRIFRLIQNLEESEATVLLTGESGTGKELVARALHLYSPRRGGTFVAVNCGALPGDLLESELFGHIRGAFTGAVRDRMGRFELASGGTLFLDEVGDLPLPLQVKLLRVLQERTFERVGESQSRTTDARIIAATHMDLQRAVLEGRFRDDLYYRLRVVPLALPPLRERREDVEPLARHLLARVGDRVGRSMLLGPDALRTMLRYDWPGNARELENALEYAVAVCRGQTIHRNDLPQEVQDGSALPSTPTREAGREIRSAAESGVVESSADIERERIRAALDSHRWSRAATAKALGMSRTTLWRRMRELGLAG